MYYVVIRERGEEFREFRASSRQAGVKPLSAQKSGRSGD